jgi:hypothetical protein
MTRNIKRFTYICTSTNHPLSLYQLTSVALFFAWIGLVQSVTTVDLLAQTDTPQAQVTSHRKMIVVTGAPGEEAYVSSFRTWSERWVNSCQDNGLSCEWIDGTAAITEQEVNAPITDKQRFLNLIAAAGDSELWIIMIGHGTFDGKIAKFNLRGEDISANELAAALAPGNGPQTVVHCFSCSGAFLPVLSRTGRIVITATKSGVEMNYSRFGDYLSLAILDSSADIDHDNSVSILEAFLMGAKLTEQFYVDERRLATEHPLLDDGGDGKGVAASFFKGIRLIKNAADGATIDGELAAMTRLKLSLDDSSLTALQLERRNELELALRKLRLAKTTMSADDYYEKLAPIALELAGLYVNMPSNSVSEGQ